MPYTSLGSGALPLLLCLLDQQQLVASGMKWLLATPRKVCCSKMLEQPGVACHAASAALSAAVLLCVMTAVRGHRQQTFVSAHLSRVVQYLS